MSALQSLPSAAIASGQVTSSSAAAADGTQDVSFAAVLSAQLSLSSAPQPASLIAGVEVPVPEEKPEQKALPPHAASDPAALDPSAGLPAVPLALSIVPVQPAVTADQGQHAEQEPAAAPADRSVSVSKVLLPSTEKTPQAEPDLAEKVPPVLALATADAPGPASFAAVLQSLPGAAQEARRHDQPVVSADAATASPPAAIMAAAPELKPEAAHREQPALTTSVPVPMQDTRWGEAFSERVVWVTGQQVQTAQIHVEPPQLGPIEVRVSIVNDQANLLFTAPHGVARDAIQMSLPRLQEMLVDSGLTLGNVSVGAHTPGSDQGRYRDSPGASGSATREVGIDSSGRQSITALRRGVGLVDLFA